MKNMVDRYLYDVVRRLPEGERSDVERELRANLQDMLGEDPEEEEIVRVLESMGEPRKLAEQYRANPRYLISPAIFEQYIAAIRIIVPVAAVAMGLLGLLFDLTEASAPPFPSAMAKVVASMVQGAFSAAMSALFATTLGFAIADYYHFKRPAQKWSPLDLPDVPPKAAVRIPRGETVTGTVLGVVLLAWALTLLKNPQLLGLYVLGKPITPLFTPEALSRFAPWFVLTSLMSLALSCFKRIWGRWNHGLAALNTVCGLVSAAVFMTFLASSGTFNPAIAAKIGEVLSLLPEQIHFYGRIGLVILLALIAVGTAVDVGTGWRKAYKSRPGA